MSVGTGGQGGDHPSVVGVAVEHDLNHVADGIVEGVCVEARDLVAAVTVDHLTNHRVTRVDHSLDVFDESSQASQVGNVGEVPEGGAPSGVKGSPPVEVQDGADAVRGRGGGDGRGPRGGLGHEVHTEVTFEPTDPDTSALFLAVVREAAANITKHAPGAACRFTGAISSDGLELTISNDVPAARRPAPSSGVGLTLVADDLERAGGSLRAGIEGTQWMVRAQASAPGARAAATGRVNTNRSRLTRARWLPTTRLRRRSFLRAT